MIDYKAEAFIRKQILEQADSAYFLVPNGGGSGFIASSGKPGPPRMPAPIAVGVWRLRQLCMSASSAHLATSWLITNG